MTTVKGRRRPTTKAKTETAPKSAPASKPTAKRAPRAKATAEKATSKPKAAPKAKAAAKPAVVETEKVVRPRDFDLHGYVKNSDSSIIANGLLETVADRKEANVKIAEAIEKVNGLTTRGGKPKNVPSLVSAILSQLEAKGYTVESTFRLVPPPEVAAELKKEQAAAKRAAARATRKKAS